MSGLKVIPGGIMRTAKNYILNLTEVKLRDR